MTPVTLYLLPGCLRCRRAKELLRSHRVPFKEVNALNQPKALARFQTDARMVFPIILIGDAILRGFDRRKLTAALRSGSRG